MIDLTRARPGSWGRSAAWLRSRIERSVRTDRESGQIMVLSLAFAVLALLLVTAVVSATGVHLERKRLFALSDALALEAADSLDLDGFYRGQAAEPRLGAVVPLTDAGVERAVAAYLADHGAVTHDLEALTVERADTPDGRTARVSITALTRPALVSWITAPWSDGIALRATSRARAW